MGTSKKLDDYRWKKNEWIAPDTHFEESIPKNNVKTPLQNFLEYFTEELPNEIVAATNQTSLLDTGKSIKLINEELMRFIALEIMIGTIGYPRLTMYWPKATEIPSLRKYMTRTRFNSLRNRLKFSSSSNKSDVFIIEGCILSLC